MSVIKADIEIAKEAKMLPIIEIAKNLGIEDDELEPYGKYKAKITDSFTKRLENKKDGKLILVTAINPTPAGEGKTTTTIGLADGLSKIGKNVTVALREPSLGPVFGVKGGAAGGGKSFGQVQPFAASAIAIFTILSSKEWNVMTAIRPPGFNSPSASSITFSTEPSSLFTAMRMAWKERLAGCCFSRRAAPGMAERITSTSWKVVSMGDS